MTADRGALSSALDLLRSEITCRNAHDGKSLIVTTGRFFSDGDAVELLVRPSEDGERVVVSDGGLTRARLDLVGSDITSNRARSMWADVLDEFGIREVGGRVFLQTKADAAAAGISVLADACVALDSVHLLTMGERHTFVDKVRAWLRSEAKVPVQDKTSVVDRFGEAQTVTAIVDSPRGDLVVQAASGRRITDLRTSMEHAFWVMGGLHESTYPLRNRLTILESVPTKSATQDRLRSMTRRLAEVSYVGSFEGQISLRTFMTAKAAPPVHDFVFDSLGQLPADIGGPADSA
ncbi:DUF1828 domain-containing protein [Mycobacterium hubeiense]|uniref:DUF1828 domain-containing protein n=1 Tax=Mycobacterium hubeiense TaxID=1867256 RepID=UPI000C7EBED2|nr:DUF1828 domain-containing protein [Mycobacterium sp. QGD 101]